LKISTESDDCITNKKETRIDGSADRGSSESVAPRNERTPAALLLLLLLLPSQLLNEVLLINRSEEWKKRCYCC